MEGKKIAAPQPRKTADSSLPKFRRYKNHKVEAPYGQDYDILNLLDMAKSPTIGPKDQAWLMTPHDGHRRTEVFAKRARWGCVAVDLDSGDWTLEEVKEAFKPFKYLAFTTSSHTPEKPRWKVIIPFQRPQSAADAVFFAEVLAELTGGDKAQARLTQGFYAPNRLSEDAPYEYIDAIGEPQEWLDLTDQTSPVVQELKKRKAELDAREALERKATPKPRLEEVSEGIISAIKGHYDIRDLLTNYGYTRKGKKYLSPNSKSGIPGVSVLEGDRVYSHHGETCPLSASNHGGHSLDVVDVLCALEYSEDFPRMIKDLANRLDPQGQKERQREYMQAQQGGQTAPQAQASKVTQVDQPNPFLPKFEVEITYPPKPPRFVVQEFIGEGVVGIAGEHGIGKTSALIPLACIAAGIHTPGNPLRPRHWRHVVYIAEDTAQAERILFTYEDYLTMQGVEDPRGKIKRRIHLIPAQRSPVELLTDTAPEYVREWKRSIEIEGNIAKENVPSPVDLLPLVVVDTIAATINLDNENDNSEVSRMVNFLKQQFQDLPLWLIGHVPKGDLAKKGNRAAPTMRGATSIEADANQVLYLLFQGKNRFIAMGKTRFQSDYRMLELKAHVTEFDTHDEFGATTMVKGLCSIPQPIDADAQEDQEDQEAQAEYENRLSDEILAKLEDGFTAGIRYNKTLLKGQFKVRGEVIQEALDRLVRDNWVRDYRIPKGLHAKNRTSFLISFTPEEREHFIETNEIPEHKKELPADWKAPLN